MGCFIKYFTTYSSICQLKMCDLYGDTTKSKLPTEPTERTVSVSHA